MNYPVLGIILLTLAAVLVLICSQYIGRDRNLW